MKKVGTLECSLKVLNTFWPVLMDYRVIFYYCSNLESIPHGRTREKSERNVEINRAIEEDMESVCEKESDKVNAREMERERVIEWMGEKWRESDGVNGREMERESGRVIEREGVDERERQSWRAREMVGTWEIEKLGEMERMSKSTVLRQVGRGFQKVEDTRGNFPQKLGTTLILLWTTFQRLSENCFTSS